MGLIKRYSRITFRIVIYVEISLLQALKLLKELFEFQDYYIEI